MIQSSDILNENIRRRNEINKPYDPVTGIGCHGERETLELSDAPFHTLYLPQPMMEEEIACRELQQAGSIKELFHKHNETLTDKAYTAFWIRFCELRYRYDFEYFAWNCITIRDKLTGKDIPFRLNRGQRLLLAALEKMRLAGLPIRIQLLKSRQWGGSTLIQLYMYWIQIIHKKNWNSVICAHVRDGSITIRGMFERAVKNMIPVNNIRYTIRNYQGTQNIREVPERGCLITVGTAIEPDSVRSQDAKMVHFSEQAYYPDTGSNNPANLETSIVGSIPAEPYTLVARESTANGVGDYFHTEWEKAKRGESAYQAVFVQWFLIDIYSKEINSYYYDERGKRQQGTVEDFIRTLTPYELNLFNNNPACTLENINWYRIKSSEMPSHSKMKQEYPSDDLEAFQDSGTPVFRAEDVEAMRSDCCLYIALGDICAGCTPSQAKADPKRRKELMQNVQFIPDNETFEKVQNAGEKERIRYEQNKLKIWEYPDTEQSVTDRYVVVYDPQKGLSDKADWGVITVFDRYWMMHQGKPEVVAEWYGHRDKDIAIWQAAQIARYYQDALLVVESNTFENEHGIYDESEFIFDTIAGVYNRLYSRTPADKIAGGAPAVYGFHTNRSTKVLIVNNFIAVLRDRDYIERSHDALNEARVYEAKANGSYGAKAGYHDDKLMTRMIGCYICYELPLPHTSMERKGIPSLHNIVSEASL